MSLSRGQRLKLLREQIGVEQKEAAARIGIAASYLSVLERDIKGRNVSHLRGTLEKAAAYYDVIPAYLLLETPQAYMQTFIEHLGTNAPATTTERLRLVLGELQLRWGEEFSPAGLAGGLGTTPGRLADYVSGKEPVSPEIVEDISRFTGVPATWFRSGPGPDQSETRPEVEGLVEYALDKGLDPQELRLLIDAWLVAKSKSPSGG